MWKNLLKKPVGWLGGSLNWKEKATIIEKHGELGVRWDSYLEA